ncbi:hypothetical protein LJ739_10990 [Aestuariibacter halophilus]|uniref:HDOD domain-containing protein n=1 Tax=Fluctibacter halophilus TaxID=226011 RepID=A0ABS8G8C3_9ALTE|nr:hypothetical protein [Aestuariibacter halophilus]MCC2616768.1 hypothetical protein [Aestuariibacter halophilus]
MDSRTRSHMDTTIAPEPLINEGLILSELERRYYLFLIGGCYEKLFYAFEGKEEEAFSFAQGNLCRILLDVEVSQSQRRQQSHAHCEAPEYKSMLDYVLKHRINARLENDDLLASCREIAAILPFWRNLDKWQTFTPELINGVLAIDWLVETIRAFSRQPKYRKQLNLPDSDDVKVLLNAMGYRLFVWLLPRWIGMEIANRLHPSLHHTVDRIRTNGRLVSGAIALSLQQQQHRLDTEQTWTLYTLAGLNLAPLILLISMISEEVTGLIEQQRANLDPEVDASKRQVLDTFVMDGDTLREFLSMEEIIKPHILENLGFSAFDPLPYILGYTNDDPISQVFHQAKAYAIYRQLFKTGRIHPRETAVFLKKYGISRSLLHTMNDVDLTDLTNHIQLYQDMMSLTKP